MRHIMSPLDFSVEELDQLLNLANDIEANPKKYAHACDGKKLATLFYEPSTRTRLSFEAAMMNLGGNVLGFSSAASSSATKGETVADTIRMVACYADICAMRHPKEGAPLVASLYSPIPVINAGDGGHQHPTQTLTDLLTIRSLKGRLDNLTIGLCGDLKFGRTVHSLISALVRYTGIRFVLISPEELRIPSYIRDDVLRENNIEFEEVERLDPASAHPRGSVRSGPEEPVRSRFSHCAGAPALGPGFSGLQRENTSGRTGAIPGTYVFRPGTLPGADFPRNILPAAGSCASGGSSLPAADSR